MIADQAREVTAPKWRALSVLAEHQADYITGASLFVDGGMTLYPGFERRGDEASDFQGSRSFEK
ncbi:MAG TPA: hypothetical protein PKC49_04645 [Phycisphaerae bacterium]|nr:hypothetical protein [Phycisphaerae bacterium]